LERQRVGLPPSAAVLIAIAGSAICAMGRGTGNSPNDAAINARTRVDVFTCRPRALHEFAQPVGEYRRRQRTA
jgi:hypothetical protein